MKTCALCRRLKPLDEFWRDKHRSDGRVAKCKECWQKIRPKTMAMNEVQAFVRARIASASPERCWIEWPYSSHHQNGRPQIRWDGSKVSVTQFGFYVIHGRKAVGQLNHTCHDMTCWNPHHVYEGTQKQNMADMRRAGRQNDSQKLTLDKADQIRRRYAAGEMGKDLAREFGVCKATVSNIVNGKIWKRPVANQD